MSIKLRGRDGPRLRCAYCRGALGQGTWDCSLCSVRLHRSCRRELGCCPTLGCDRRSGAAPQPVGMEGLIFGVFFFCFFGILLSTVFCGMLALFSS